ncbi:Hemolysin E [Pseudolycoriella hygida]|uniref:Hemolysin E n=1 Tax=Pseudolycoriella hygida TaxID=35572 RepID=A0A9Q0NC44_9DIPT|nr:Hemolysin E [Pseudolycoriella hygida]
MSAAGGAAAIKEVIEITKEGIETIYKVLDLFDKVLDQIVPWETYEQTLKELDRFRSDYSNESAQLVGEVKALIKNADDNYFSATQFMYEWCSLTKRLLQIYLDLFGKRTSNTYAAQRGILVKVLDDGLTKMSAGQAELEQCSINFNNVAGKLTTLNTTLAHDFDSKSSYFQRQVDKISKRAYLGEGTDFVPGPFGVTEIVQDKLIPELQAKMQEVKGFFEKLQGTIEQTNVDIDSIKGKLKDKVKSIGVLKVQTEEAEQIIPLDYLDELRDTISETVNNLIKECNLVRETSTPSQDLESWKQFSRYD